MMKAEARAGSGVIYKDEITTGKLYDWKLAVLQLCVYRLHCGMLVG
jgi:hypothetical protein